MAIDMPSLVLVLIALIVMAVLWLGEWVHHKERQAQVKRVLEEAEEVIRDAEAHPDGA